MSEPSVCARSYDEHDDWVRDEPRDGGVMSFARSPYRHVVRFDDGTERFPLGWCPECQSWEERDYYAPSTHRWMTTANAPTTGGWHGLLDSRPKPSDSFEE